jgi:hypothetical protein
MSFSMFGPIQRLVIRCSLFFDLMSFGVWSFSVWSFGVRSFGVWSFGVRSFGVRSSGVRSFGIGSFSVGSFGVRSFGVRSFGVPSFRYHQIPVATADIPKTAIITLCGLWVFFMPFGLSNAAQTFQCVMDRTLEGLEGTFPYMDNSRVGSPNR